MLLRSDAGKRLEPVCIMGCAVSYSPVFHGGRHSIGDVDVQTRVFVNGLPQRLINLSGQIRFHDPVVKYHTSEIVRYLFHNYLSLSVTCRRRHFADFYISPIRYFSDIKGKGASHVST